MSKIKQKQNVVGKKIGADEVKIKWRQGNKSRYIKVNYIKFKKHKGLGFKNKAGEPEGVEIPADVEFDYKETVSPFNDKVPVYELGGDDEDKTYVVQGYAVHTHGDCEFGTREKEVDETEIVDETVGFEPSSA